METKTALQTAIDLFGGQEAMAKHFGLGSMAITQWKSRGVPAKYCPAIELATSGQVTAHMLNPDVFPKTTRVA